VTEKSEAIAMCKELPVIPVNSVMDPKRIIGKMEVQGGGKAQGVADPKKSYDTQTRLLLCMYLEGEVCLVQIIEITCYLKTPFPKIS
jgi:hypothetical protein